MRSPQNSFFKTSLKLLCYAATLISGACLPTYESGFDRRTSSRNPQFTFHLSSEPYSLNPLKMRGVGSNYFYNHLFRGLTRYVKTTAEGFQETLSFEGAEKCETLSELRLLCSLSPSHKWSDGQRVTALEYVKTFQNFARPENRAIRFDLIKNLLNAKKIQNGFLDQSKLGVRAASEFKIEFLFEKPEPEFLYVLASPLLVPTRLARDQSFDFNNFERKDSSLITNGPYKIKSWSPGKSIVLTRNAYYKNFEAMLRSYGRERLPDAKVLFIKEDQTALNLYLKNELTFLRRLPFHLISSFKKRSDYFQNAVQRFDYIGFGPSLIDKPWLRKSIVHAIDYSELKKLFQSDGRPGCPGISQSLYLSEKCLQFDLKKAKSSWAKISPKDQKKTYTLQFSRLGGEHHRIFGAWLQGQLLKNLGLKLNILQLDQKYFLQKLKKFPPDLFRMGIGIDRPTCVTALSPFKNSDHRNYIRYKNTIFDKLIETLEQESIEVKKKQHCDLALNQLLNSNRIIPTGPIQFSILARPHFKGWKINSLNHLDLTDLFCEKKGCL